ncbi:DEAH-box ATP-dependent RNA helicase prp43 [Geranomyces variabilis]|nr:DEAH-box ATP-dependent RNA helicase prp43 [Geranomyces variabilis]
MSSSNVPSIEALVRAHHAREDRTDDNWVLRKPGRKGKTPPPVESQSLLTARRNLPVEQSRGQIIDLVKNNRVVVITAATGSGKTTQIPTFLLHTKHDDRQVWNDWSEIVVTQPRRIAAMGVAERVAKELGVQVGGGVVDCHIKGYKKIQAGSRIRFCTEGVLLQRLVNIKVQNKPFHYLSHIILDEAHERTRDTDLLLGALKLLMKEGLWHGKLIIMSATLNAESFSAFFRDAVGDVPILNVPGRTHKVDIFFAREETTLGRTIAQVHKCRDQGSTPVDVGDILAFVGGLKEVKEANQELRAITWRTRVKLEHFFLHSKASSFIQQLALTAQMPVGTRKLIMATSIAETSLTIENVKYVIDNGTVRLSRYNPRNGKSTLFLEEISQASAQQRAGRAGRTAPGFCYRTYSRAVFNDMDPISTPAIQREEFTACLLILLKAGWDVVSFPFLDPPSDEQVQDAINILSWMGAMDDDSLTEIGREMADLRVDPRAARALVEAKASGCADQVAAITAISPRIDVLWLPSHNQKQKEKTVEMKRRYQHKDGEHLTVLRIMREFYEVGGASSNPETVANVIQWCEERRLSHACLADAVAEHKEIRESLSLPPHLINLETSNIDEQMSALVRRSLTFGYFLNVARVDPGEDTKPKRITKEVRHTCFRNPRQTVAHPSVWVARKRWLLYDDLQIGEDFVIQGATSFVEQSWLEEAAPALDFETHPLARRPRH